MTDYPSIAPLNTAFSHRCPRCGQGALYRGYLTIRDKCDHCGLAYSEHDVGDGPAFFTITLLGFVVVGIAFAAEIFFRPSYFEHALIVLIPLFTLTPLCLRFFKSYLIAIKYRLHWKEEQP